jgi:hypothetical protein
MPGRHSKPVALSAVDGQTKKCLRSGRKQPGHRWAVLTVARSENDWRVAHRINSSRVLAHSFDAARDSKTRTVDPEMPSA